MTINLQEQSNINMSLNKNLTLQLFLKNILSQVEIPIIHYQQSKISNFIKYMKTKKIFMKKGEYILQADLLNISILIQIKLLKLV